MEGQGTSPTLESGKKKNSKKDPTCSSRPVTRGRRCKLSRESSEEEVRQQVRDDDDVQNEAEEPPPPPSHEPSSDKEASDEDEPLSDDDDDDDDDETDEEQVVEQAPRAHTTQQPSLAAATDDFELFQLASDAAKHQVQGWIRAVLREVVLQSLRTCIQNAAAATSKVVASSTEEQGDDDDDDDDSSSSSSSSSNKKKSRIQINLDVSDIQQAASCCRLVAKRWMEHLQKAGHDTAGAWIDQVVQAEIDNLFYQPQPDCSNTVMAAPASAAAATSTAAAMLPSESATAPAATTTAPTFAAAQGPPNSTVAPAAAGGKEAAGIEVMRTTTPYARLRSLGAIDYYSWQTQSNDAAAAATATAAAIDVQDDDERRLDEAIREIDQLGRNGQTYWPYSWSYIEQAAAQIQQRLYNSNTTAQLQQQQVDEIIVPSNQSQLQNSEQQTQQEREQDALEWLLVNRKRKSSGKRQLPGQKRRTVLIQQLQGRMAQNDLLLPVIKRRQQRERQRMEHSSDNTSIPRPATNDSGYFQWNIQEGYASFTQSEKKRLDACIHFDNPPEQREATAVAGAAASEPPSSILLGSLCPVGQYHYSKQRWIDDDTGKKNKKGQSEQQQQETGTMANNDIDLCRQNKEQKRQHRRQRNLQRVGMRQRLGDHSEVTVNHGVGKRKRVSKILQTTATSLSSLLSSSMENPSNNNQQQHQQQQQQQLVNPPSPEHWMDFDLGYCMLELVVDPHTGKKGLYAFESLEVMALDENDFSEDEEEEECDAT